MKYTSAAAFRRALEDRLKQGAPGDSARISRDRKRISFDRLLARLIAVKPDTWVLKGGFALELRLQDRARTTKDIDLAWHAAQSELIETLIDVSIADVGDYFTFTLDRVDQPPDHFAGAQRFRVTASLAGRTFEAFVLDVGQQSEPFGDTDLLTTPGLLEFAGIQPITIPALSLAGQVAEKLHAYTRVYEGDRTSSRTKDLIDLALVTHLFSLDAGALRTAIKAVFDNRGTHRLPQDLPLPPQEWRLPYRHLADEVGAGP